MELTKEQRLAKIASLQAEIDQERQNLLTLEEFQYRGEIFKAFKALTNLKEMATRNPSIDEVVGLLGDRVNIEIRVGRFSDKDIGNCVLIVVWKKAGIGMTIAAQSVSKTLSEALDRILVELGDLVTRYKAENMLLYGKFGGTETV